MANDQRHVIQVAEIELQISDESVAGTLFERMSRLNAGAITDVIEAQCDKYGATHTTFRIDALELDLGIISEASLEKEFLSKLELKLSEALKAAFVAETNGAATQPSQAGSDMEMLVFYLLNGAMPWWANVNEPSMLHAALHRLVQTHSKQLGAVLPGTLLKTGAAKRLVSLAAETDFLVIVRLLAGLPDLVQDAWPRALAHSSGIAEKKAIEQWRYSYLQWLLINREGTALSFFMYSAFSLWLTFAELLMHLNKGFAASGKEIPAGLSGIFNTIKAGNAISQVADQQKNVAISRPEEDWKFSETPPDGGTTMHNVHATETPSLDILEEKLKQFAARPEQNSSFPAQNDIEDFLFFLKHGTVPVAVNQQEKSSLDTLLERILSSGAMWLKQHITALIEHAVVRHNLASLNGPYGFHAIVGLLHGIPFLAADDWPVTYALATGSGQAAMVIKWREIYLAWLITHRQGAELSFFQAAAIGMGCTFSDLIETLESGFARAQSSVTIFTDTLDSVKTRKNEIPKMMQQAMVVTPRQTVDLRYSESDELFIDNAGLVLLGVFLPHFFVAIGLVADSAWVSEEAQQKGVSILYFLVSGLTEVREFQTALLKVFCGLHPADPLEYAGAIDDEIQEECENLLQSVIAHAGVFGTLSADGLRGSYLLRPGLLSMRDGNWLVQVEKKAYDILLTKIPWSFRMIKLPWQPRFIVTEW